MRGDTYKWIIYLLFFGALTAAIGLVFYAAEGATVCQNGACLTLPDTYNSCTADSDFIIVEGVQPDWDMAVNINAYFMPGYNRFYRSISGKMPGQDYIHEIVYPSEWVTDQIWVRVTVYLYEYGTLSGEYYINCTGEPTDTPEPTLTQTLTSTATFTRTPSVTPSPTPSSTPTFTPTNTPTFTPSPTNTPTNTPTPTCDCCEFCPQQCPTETPCPPCPSPEPCPTQVTCVWPEYEECLIDDTHYCPDRPYTRGELAKLAVRIQSGPGYEPPPAQNSCLDTVGHQHEDWIAEAQSRGLAEGCIEGLFRPDQWAERDDWAPVLVLFLGVAVSY